RHGLRGGVRRNAVGSAEPPLGFDVIQGLPSELPHQHETEPVKLLLKDFQTEVVDKLVTQLRRAASEARAGELQSVCLSSPTGSGKTVMVTAAIERIVQGDDGAAPEPEATFLWITDQPELNEQTRRKMLTASSVLTTDKLL